MPTEPTPQMTPPSISYQPINQTQSGLDVTTKKRRKKPLLITILVIVIALCAAIGGLFVWYNRQLEPVGDDHGVLIKIEIVSGSTSDQIGQLLEDNGIIRSAKAFSVYTRLSGARGALQAGQYRLSPADSTQIIVEHIISGRVDEFDITFLPGATLAEHKKVLQSAGFSEEEIEAAFAQTYDSPIFDDKPSTADLEGYIYGETYHFYGGASVEDILNRTFEEFYGVIQAEHLEAAFEERGLNLYQGITLASIIQREVSGAADQKQVAQVFYARLAIDMQLGSDVTYQYIADKLGVERDVNIDSPYNTRRYTGLPPGPIASPGLSALLAVAEPAEGDYLYFLSGDDDVTYFARTNEEHEANITDHCQIKCQQL